MAILALPLFTSILKPHKTHFSFLLTTKPLPIILQRRFFSKSASVPAVSTSSFSCSSSSSSSHVSHNSEQKSSVLTFQQVIQRLQVLSEELPDIIASISFPKSMHWNSDVVFSRPIRWILALHGGVVLPFMYAGVVSGNVSHGLRNTPSATVKILDAETYANVMQDAGIITDVEKHQKYFAMIDENGELFPYFVTVANGSIDDKVVRKGNEAVLRARFEDANFFYEMDTNRKFSEFRPYSTERDSFPYCRFHDFLEICSQKLKLGLL